MDWIISATLFLSVLNAALCFNIDPVAWKTLSNSAAGFGYQVVQRQSDLLISAPLEQYSQNGRGEIFRCSTSAQNCQNIQLQAPGFAVNMSLGLTMKSDPTAQNTVVCGPTIPKDCKSITMYNGVCFEIDPSNRFGPPVPSSLEVCPPRVDIAFLLDGSGSVSSGDFQTMKKFVKDLIQSFLSIDAQFSVSQFSRSPQVHFYFKKFSSSGSVATDIDGISQHRGATFTAKAIKHLVENVFTSHRRSRPDVKKVLIVITDGESNDRSDLGGSVQLAKNKNIVRFAIGVGNAFTEQKAKRELDTIASSPSDKHVFQVKNFNALEIIRQNLQDKISVEGSQTSGQSLKMEMSQEGFSAVYVPEGIQMSIVGANQWKGGYVQYTTGGQKLKTYEDVYLEPDSYLGYSMATAKTQTGSLTVVGAPRYKHRGVVVAVNRQSFENQKIEPLLSQYQTGEYFGAEVCAMDINNDDITDLIFISAPMYTEPDREGRVYVCRLIGLFVECNFNDPLILRGRAAVKGRFGSSLAVLPDLNSDGFRDLAVGAPLENNGEGSIYIFHSEGGERISPTYSQRITGSEVESGLKFFGLSISQSSFDQSGDKLPDLAVGSKGRVVLLRSRPIVMVKAEVSFSPIQIPTQNVDCSKPLKNTANICFTMSAISTVNTDFDAQARINYTLTPDATRKPPNNRAFVNGKQREESSSLTVELNGKQCSTVTFVIEACPEDALNALSNELKFTFDGLPSNTQLRPSLAPQARTTTTYPLEFEISCGSDNKCVDHLKVDFNFTRSSEVKVGIDELLNVTVTVENRGENSYNSRVILTYPAGLSYRKFTIQQGRIECNSMDSEDGLSQGRTDCTIDKPIFKSKTKAFFTVSYGIDTNSQLEREIFVTANATSGNQDHAPTSDLYKKKSIDVKYSIFMTFESSHSYNNFTFGMNDLQKPVQQSVKVTNDIRTLNFTVVIKVPVKLGEKDIWVNLSSLQISDCQRGDDEEPSVRNFVENIQKNKAVDCSVAMCRVFKCNAFMGRLQSRTYEISANLSSGWIEQIGLQSARFLLISTASLVYDKNQYIYFSTGSDNNSPVRKIEAEVEVYPQPDFTKAIVGGALGGLAFLALITAGLYKGGFFKSKYKQMISENPQEVPVPEMDAGALLTE
ncbi:integrin alpha-M isoform X1 [Haplochromis burtoni]|uniref:integrin alpha-M isoform X1 n=1 Tax=Haplochromis burtoni TaxID=8153 RepID=UPI001C2D2DF7|nr:integrin alpha-M isoform X1 [Haplochromis burtoni]XP_042071717.1 integrin alpha-M isoform X1 [Haplochromis burtoni]